MKTKLIAIAFMAFALTVFTVGCAQERASVALGYTLATTSRADMDGSNIRPVTVENKSPYTIFVEGGRTFGLPVHKIEPGSHWVIMTEQKSLVMTAEGVGQCEKHLTKKDDNVVVSVADFPQPAKTNNSRRGL